MVHGRCRRPTEPEGGRRNQPPESDGKNGEAPDLQAGGAGALVPSGFREPHCSFGEEPGILLCRRGVLTLNADDIPATRRRIPPWQS